MSKPFTHSFVLFLCCLLLWTSEGQAKRKGRSRRIRHTGPPPVVLWSTAISKSTNLEERKVNAFKLSQYSQPILQQEVIDTLLKCTRDPDTHVKVLCTRALRNAKKQTKEQEIRQTLLDLYESDPDLRNTIVRTLIERKDDSDSVHDFLLKSAQSTKDVDHLVTLLQYFESFGSGSDVFVKNLNQIYQAQGSNFKIKKAVAKVLAEKGSGQPEVVALLSDCATSSDTPLQLICLFGIETQTKNDPNAWNALKLALESGDLDVLHASLDALLTFDAKSDTELGKRLLEVIKEVSDPEIQEKAVLALGITGDRSVETVERLQKILLASGDVGEGTEGMRIAAALVLGKQAALDPEKSKQILSDCIQLEKSRSLKTACTLGKQELETESALAKNQKVNEKTERTPSSNANTEKESADK